MPIFARSTKTRIFKKSAKGGHGETFEKSPKNEASLKRQNSTLEQMALSFSLHAIIVQRLENNLAQRAAPKVPE